MDTPERLMMIRGLIFTEIFYKFDLFGTHIHSSSFNMEECNAVMDFIDELLITDKYHLSASDIGVVSPYKLQCKKIQQRCKKSGYNEIRIGSAETFQGQERKAMIISTVQSGQKTLGKFLMNPQVRSNSFSLYFRTHSNDQFGIFAAIQRNDHTCEKSIDCCGKSTIVVTR